MNKQEILDRFSSMSDEELNAVEVSAREDIYTYGALMQERIARHAKVCQDIEECTWLPF